MLLNLLIVKEKKKEEQIARLALVSNFLDFIDHVTGWYFTESADFKGIIPDKQMRFKNLNQFKKCYPQTKKSKATVRVMGLFVNLVIYFTPQK